MQMNTTLTALELNGNNIDYDGATALAEAITQNTSLAVLHLRCEDTPGWTCLRRWATKHMHACHGCIVAVSVRSVHGAPCCSRTPVMLPRTMCCQWSMLHQI